MKFFCDSMLGKLANYLRVLGIDTEYSRSSLFDLKIEKAICDSRIFLTRDTRIFSLKKRPDFVFVKSNFPDIQLFEVLKSFENIREIIKPFSRCIRCNCELVYISKGDVENRVPDYVYQTQSSFSFCRECNNIYWQGTHYKRMRLWVDKVIENVN